MLRSDLCDYSDVYIVVKERITVEGGNYDKTRNKKLIFKNNAPFRSCILKINNTFINNAEDLDIVMPMYNLLEYTNNYSMKSGSLWNYYKDEANNNDANIPLKYLSNLWRSLNLPLIKCAIELDLSWSKECIISETSITSEVPGKSDANPPVPGRAAIQKTSATFQINNAKHFVPVVTLSINDTIKFL